MQKLDETDTHFIVLDENDSAEMVTKTGYNRLLYEHDLWNVLKTGEETLVLDGREWQDPITLIPHEGAHEFTLQIRDHDKLHLGEHHKSDLIDALDVVFNEHDGDDIGPLFDLYDEIRSGMVRDRLMTALADNQPFADRVQVLDDGWLVNGHLKITWEGEFFHPETTSRTRSGSIIERGSNTEAYSVTFRRPDTEMDRDVMIDGHEWRLTDAELEFIARGLWAMANTPDKRGETDE